MNIKKVKRGGWMAASGLGLWLWVWYMFEGLAQNGAFVALAVMFAIYGGFILVASGLFVIIYGLILKSPKQK